MRLDETSSTFSSSSSHRTLSAFRITIIFSTCWMAAFEAALYLLLTYFIQRDQCNVEFAVAITFTVFLYVAVVVDSLLGNPTLPTLVASVHQKLDLLQNQFSKRSGTLNLKYSPRLVTKLSNLHHVFTLISDHVKAFLQPARRG